MVVWYSVHVPVLLPLGFSQTLPLPAALYSSCPVGSRTRTGLPDAGLGVVAEVAALVGVIGDETAVVDHQVGLPDGVHLAAGVGRGDVLADRAGASALPSAGGDDVNEIPARALGGA